MDHRGGEHILGFLLTQPGLIQPGVLVRVSVRLSPGFEVVVVVFLILEELGPSLTLICWTNNTVNVLLLTYIPGVLCRNTPSLMWEWPRPP